MFTINSPSTSYHELIVPLTPEGVRILIITVDGFINENEKIKAIKYLRESMGGRSWGLKASKDFVDNWSITRRLLETAMRSVIEGQYKYAAVKQDFIDSLVRFAGNDFDEQSVAVLKEDLNKCSEALLRWMAYRIVRVPVL